MMLCLVTDRRRLGAAMGLGSADLVDALRAQVTAAARAGVDFIQVREPDLEAAELAALVRDLMRQLEGTSSRLLVNDRVDVAIAAQASGVHLKEQSILPEDVRRISPPGFVIGCSVHTPAVAAARKSADFLIAGTVRPTVSKPGVEYLDQAGLAAIVQAAAAQPVLGIGGLDISSMSLLAGSCASGMAAVSAFIPTAGEDLSKFVQKCVAELRFGFDSASRRT